MKNTLYLFIFVLSGCMSNFDVVVMNNKFEKKKSTEKYSHIDIYWSENELDKNFVVLSEAVYSPLTFWPFSTYKKAITKNWILKSVENCNELGGDAVIMGHPSFSSVIKYSELNQAEMISKTNSDKQNQDAREKAGPKAKDIGLEPLKLSIEDFEKVGVAWLGVDYRFAHFLNIKEKEANEETLMAFISESNNIIVNEPGKYDFNSFLKHKFIIPNISEVNEANLNIDAMSMIASNESNTDLQSIQDAISKYDLSEIYQDICVMLFAESFNKSKGIATYQLIILNARTKKIIKSAQIEGAPGGSGFTNYWTGSVAETENDIKKAFKSWTKK
ncbi:MAG: hypothetical protein KC454_11075 [Flavobacteriales bacterium]|nr:hypothetical protein [Flavobacteriales bacterium]|tara:strand:+ start:231 stop:1223 length:993 start_codon:yes stop_codon:yes gene_type:complete